MSLAECMPFYPVEYGVPFLLCAPTFRARPLGVADVARDYAAYVSSPETIRIHSGGRWPVEGFSIADNRCLVAQHEDEHRMRERFTFTLLDADEVECLGCLYIMPLRPFFQRAAVALCEGVDDQAALVTFWVRQCEQAAAFEQAVVVAVRDWLVRDWHFSFVAFRANDDERSTLRAFLAAGLSHYVTIDVPQAPHRYHFYSIAPISGL